MNPILLLRRTLCGLLAETDHIATRELAVLGICIADIFLGGPALAEVQPCTQ
jgi:hypothetical protein